MDTVTLSNAPTAEDTVGMFVIVNDGREKGASLEIASRSGDAFTVRDATRALSRIAVGTRVTVGGRFYRDRVDHNVVALSRTAAKSGFNTTGELYGRVTRNLFYDTPSTRFRISSISEATINASLSSRRPDRVSAVLVLQHDQGQHV